MMKDHCLAQAISDVGLFEFRRQIEYKAKWNNRKVIFTDTFYPSSKTCSCCGWKNSDLKLTDRVFECKVYLDRKYKLYLECAAQTILRKKRSDITVEQIRDLFDKHRTWRGVAKELKTSTGRLYLIREGLGMIDSQNRKKKEKEGAE